jgi:hypothetical protein
MKGNGKSANELYSYSIPYVLPFANKEIKVEQFKNVVKKYDKDALEHYSVIFNELYSIP